MDHCQNAAFISGELNVPIAISRADEELIENNMLQKLYAKTLAGRLVLFFSEKSFYHDKIPEFIPKVYLQDGDTLELSIRRLWGKCKNYRFAGTYKWFNRN